VCENVQRIQPVQEQGLIVDFCFNDVVVLVP
jgi:hypothetical protein